MAKKKSLLSLLKRFFISDTDSQLVKKNKRKRWTFQLLKMKQLPPSSGPSPPREAPPWKAAEQSNNVVPVIVAADSPDVGNLPSNIQSAHQQKKSQESSQSNNIVNNPLVQDLAATKIQAAFHGYLARKALRALKGVVKLQALIRGWAVRQQAINTLKCLQSIVSIQSEVCSKRRESSTDSLHCLEYTPGLREKDIMVDLNSQKRWDDSTLTKEETKVLSLNKKEAAIKRDRIKEYYLKHRRLAETGGGKVYGFLDRALSARDRDEVGGRLLNLKYMHKQYQAEVAYSLACVPRRSFRHRKQHSIGDDDSFAGSPAIPTYMAPTKSAKAKENSPRLRPINFDVCSEITSPYKYKLSPISSINSELTSSSWIGNPISSSLRSPRLKGLFGPINSTMSVKDLHLQGIHYQNRI
ncbi:hypothetical protein ACJIZ3_016043 [Penstemon smallii]|uniref:DUF4005 domain-containing protein n=1 Tax=Penstemon smallii TaxID=265156 RepID=A0ABD3RP86_9LAMI